MEQNADGFQIIFNAKGQGQSKGFLKEKVREAEPHLGGTQTPTLRLLPEA